MFTIIFNMTERELNLGFVPPHGAKLPVNDWLFIDGDLRSLLASGLKRYSRHRELKALTYEEDDGRCYVWVIDTEPVPPVPPSSSSSAPA